jgi:hypothetical protein
MELSRRTSVLGELRDGKWVHCTGTYYGDITPCDNQEELDTWFKIFQARGEV